MAISAKKYSDTSVDLADFLKQYSSSDEVEATMEDDDGDDDIFVKTMVNKVMSSIAEANGDDDDGDMFALMMSDADDDAVAKDQFFRRLRRVFRRVRRGVRRVVRKVRRGLRSPIGRCLVSRIPSLLGKKK